MQTTPTASFSAPERPFRDFARALAECKQLKTLTAKKTQVTAAGVAALQKALPDCKIEWDGAAKPKTTEPAASFLK